MSQNVTVLAYVIIKLVLFYTNVQFTKQREREKIEKEVLNLKKNVLMVPKKYIILNCLPVTCDLFLQAHQINA
jgi:hypothetical protein